MTETPTQPEPETESIDEGLADRLAGRNKRHRYNLSAPAPQPEPKYNKDGTLSKRQPRRAKPKYTIPSVTTIINVMDKPGLPWGAAKETALMAVYDQKRWVDLDPETAVNNLKVEHQRVWGLKAAIGTVVHDAAMAWTLGIGYDIEASMGRNLTMALEEEMAAAAAKIHGCLDALERFYDEQKPEWQHIERTIAHPGIEGIVEAVEITPGVDIPHDPTKAYMGGFDAMGTIKDAPDGALIDLKTGSPYADSLTLQLSAYARAKYLCTYDQDGHLTRLDPFHAPRYRAGLYLHEDGTYDLVRVPAGKEAYQHFRYCRRIYEWRSKMADWHKRHENRKNVADQTQPTNEGEME